MPSKSGYQLPSSFEISRASDREGYPRVVVPKEVSDPALPYPSYAPVHYDAPRLLEDPKPDWADEQRIDPAVMRARRMLSGHEYELVPLLADGRALKAPDGQIVLVPKNPYVRTGKTGRGELGRYGENWAGDLVLIRYEPGCEPEEIDAGAKIEQVYQGPCDDPRNTDNAWMMTTAFSLLLTGKSAETRTEADGKEVSKAEWKNVDELESLELFASHADYIHEAIARLPDDGLPKQILLIYRGDGSESWGVPGGMADPGEAPIQTAIREAGEEAGKALQEAVTELHTAQRGATEQS